MPAACSQLVTAKTTQLLAEGVNQTDAAKIMGVSRRLVNGMAKRHKADIEAATLRLIEKTLPIIEETHINTMRIARDLTRCDENSTQVAAKLVLSGLDPKDILQISDKKEYRMMQVMGICPSNTPSTVITQIFGNQSITLVDPGVRQLLGGQLDRLEDDTIEAEVVE